ncbi:DUF4404 family protein [Aeoliella mucimassa]|uniref:DUF4404 domain-containing protein n=1 Tax=Aeoliella mucimassa TaxID=2527972 RepID=A0A518AHH7_9BACT|nr:DUF4404 family protein [Aeoliella mucimassa]QDU54193.1 hypothetical protein Pan181_03730 [Aeoliella mucimassa]
MNSDHLREHLTQLHQELSTVHQVDEPTKEMLVTLLKDITNVLSGEASSDDSSTAPSSDSIRAMMADFETEHPKLAQALGQLADGLANLGI